MLGLVPSDWAPGAEPAHATFLKPTHPLDSYPIPGSPRLGLAPTPPFPALPLPSPQHVVLVFHTDAVGSSYT